MELLIIALMILSFGLIGFFIWCVVSKRFSTYTLPDFPGQVPD